jgi:hypothetical protein
MATTREEIGQWFDAGVQAKATHMIVVCDTFEYNDYPAYVGSVDEFYERYDHYNGKNMQRIMEVYDLRVDKAEQLAQHRALRLPPRPSSQPTGSQS